jgi:hypothetical protein
MYTKVLEVPSYSFVQATIGSDAVDGRDGSDVSTTTLLRQPGHVLADLSVLETIVEAYTAPRPTTTIGWYYD